MLPFAFQLYEATLLSVTIHTLPVVRYNFHSTAALYLYPLRVTIYLLTRCSLHLAFTFASTRLHIGVCNTLNETSLTKIRVHQVAMGPRFLFRTQLITYLDL